MLGARMTDSRPAGVCALPLVMAPVGAFVQTGLAIGRRHDGCRGLGVAFLGGGLGLRQAHGSLRSKSKTWRQRYQQNAQHKAHDGISLLRKWSVVWLGPPPNVRFGSKADMATGQRDVRFTPRKQTFRAASGMSAKCQERTSTPVAAH